MKTPHVLSLGLPLIAISLASAQAEMKEAAATPVSYHKDVRPIFQAKCQGCHQPAKMKGDYLMTTVEQLIAGGETDVAVVPHKPDASYLIEQIIPAEGEKRAEMPPKGDTMTDEEVAIVKKWITEGAIDDTPENASQIYDNENPPQYAVAPVVTSLDFSPDGKLLAVAGFHEVLLHRADGSGLEARLIGLSERIESAKFSPDGKLLAVAGGLPGQMGEIQVWDVAKRELKLSKSVSYDTAYGVSWSPDGKMIAFGLPDKTMRAINASNGEQAVFMGGHGDWVLDTTFNQKGDHIVSVGRDMATKLTKVETERFIDNVSSITPGALKGGIAAIELHPTQDHVLVGGSDGVPQIYRMFRETVRKIGDNANLIRKYPAMKGRIWDVAFAPDGKRFVAGSSLNGKGQIAIYNADYDATITPELKKAMETARREVEGKVSAQQKMIDEFQTKGVKQLASIEIDASIFSVAWSPDGKTIVASGDDGQIRLIDPAKGAVKTAFTPIDLNPDAAIAAARNPKAANLKKGKHSERPEELPRNAKVTSLQISPATITLDSPNAYNQLLVSAKLDTGDHADLTRSVKWSLDQPLATISELGIAKPAKEGEATLTATFAEGLTATAKVKVSGMNNAFHPDFIRDVNPVISRLGCNMGTCHGAKDGQNGFKLSLRGYDPIYDVRGFSDDHTARRVNYASPDDSLMLMKATAAVPHEAGMVTELGSDYYHIIRQWIAEGAKLNSDAAKVTHIEVFPKNPVIQNTGGRQQLRVVAHYADGLKRDVTREAFIDSGNSEVAEHDDFGLMTTIRRGEAPILARYEGAYAATTLTVMGDREGFTWEKPETWTKVDELVAGKWERMKIRPSGLCTDEEYIRRIYLDLTGLPPTPENVTAFLADKAPNRQKREAVVDQLIGSPEFVEHWTNKWSDMLQVNSKFLGKEGAQVFRDWIREKIDKNMPYDEFVYAILTASGSNKENPAASYYKILREPEAIMENTTHLFLATRFNCNKCHDHPFEKWNQDQYYETTAYFAQIGLDRDMTNAKTANIGGSAVENPKPLYEIVKDLEKGDTIHQRTNAVTAPEFPYPAKYERAAFKNPEKPTRREELAAWMTSDDNRFFAMSYANRIWGYLLGTGVIEPLDDIRAGNPPTNPELLDHLTKSFIASDFNVRELMSMIVKSRTYQLSIESNQWNADDTTNFSKAKARRLPAEVLFDTVYAVTGATPNIPGAKPGMRAQQLADSQIDLPSGFLANLGRPPRESACECERQNDVQLGSVMSLLSGPAVADAVGDPKNALTKLVDQTKTEEELIAAIYLRVLNRRPTPNETKQILASWGQMDEDHQSLVAKLADAEAKWVPIKAKREQNRLSSINAATAAITAYQPEHDKKAAEAEKARKERLAKAQAAEAASAKGIPTRSRDWESKLPVERLWTEWTAIKPTKVSANNGVSFEVLDDKSTVGKRERNSASDYAITLDVPMQNVTGIMIEALPNDKLTSFGPGLNNNGNFVVTEVQLQWADKADPKKQTTAKFKAAATEHIQKGFDVKNAINGSLSGADKGWAVGGQERKPHFARFQLEKPIAAKSDKGSTFTLKIMNRYASGEYPLGSFRIWVTSSAQPLNLGIPSEIASIIKTAPHARTPEQTKALTAYYTAQDHEWLAKHQATVRETRPLPADPKMTQLKAALAKASLPTQTDPALIQIRTDVDYSIQQSANRRLTAAQDLTWALINNPAFLFNH